MPTRDHPYLSSSRIFKREGTSDKQYIVRVFDVHGRYVVIAWNGRNGESSTLRLQPKGVYRSLGEAQRVAEDLISSKRAEGYQRGTDSNNPNLLGTPAPARAGMRPQPDLSARTELDIDDTDSELERIHRNPLGRTNRDMTPITEINGVRINQPVRGVDPDMTMDEETLKESRKKDKKTPDKKIDLNAPSDESLKSLLDELETPEGLDFGV
jgi:predicted DNA-binding WGR domain protein